MSSTRKVVAGFFTALAVLLLPVAVSAHVVVQPDQVGVAAFQTFTTSVPNEKEVPVTSLRLVLPAGLQEVTPTVKAGWDITTKKSGENITEIAWNGGTIPAGMRDDFTFSAQAPAKATTLQWRAYEGYEDGTVVSWDQTPTNSGDDESTDKGPYSTTKVVNDLTESSTTGTNTTGGNQTGAYVLSGAALAAAIVALLVAKRSSAVKHSNSSE